MNRNRANVKVTAKDCRGNVDKMIRRFIKKSKKEKIVEQIRERRHYKKPSVAKKEKRNRSQRLRKREELKRVKAQERRNRKK